MNAIVDLFVENGLLTAAQAQELQRLQESQGGKLSSLLIEKKFAKKETLINFIKTTLNLSTADTSQLKTIDPQLAGLIRREIAEEYRLLPLAKDGDSLTVGLTDPLSILDLDDIKPLSEYTVTPVLLPESNFAELVKTYPGSRSGPVEAKDKAQTMESILKSTSGMALRPLEEITEAGAAHISKEVPIVKATNFIFDRAIEARASDILIEPLSNMTRIRFRVDGIFRKVETLPRSFHPFVVSRIKVISDLDIAEKRLPQDGQFKIKFKEKEVDFRVSVFPTINGEKVALRILDRSLGMLLIDKLGFRKEVCEKLKSDAVLPYGMILLCGPAGSGKTTTLYALLKHIHSPEKNIVTVEDPVEYQIKGINQVSVNARIGLNFSKSLRSILRQDPDVVMIGEIRDFETVDIAIKAALTGHLVLSTLHTTTSAGSIIRLIDMAVEPFLINASLVAVVAQRLARRICPNCKEPVPSLPYFRGRGCDQCFNTGYSGRILIPEVLHMSPQLKEYIVGERVAQNRIKEITRSEGMVTLREEGEQLALAGLTTKEEVLRLTPAD